MGGNELRTLMDQLKNKLGSGIVLLGSASGDKVSLIAGVTADLTAKVKAGELVNFVAQQVGGTGGGRPDMAQAGGTQPDALPAALGHVAEWVETTCELHLTGATPATTAGKGIATQDRTPHVRGEREAER